MKRTLLHYTEKLKKPLHILTAFAVIICTVFAFPQLSFANDYNYSFDEQPLPIGNSNSDPTGGFLVYRENPQSATSYVRTAYSSSDNTYVFYVTATPYGNDIIHGFVYACPTENTTAFTFNYYVRDNVIRDLRNQPLSLVDSQTGYYYYIQSVAYGNSENLPSYTTITEGLSALSEYIENSNTPTYNFETVIEVPSGSVAYIGIPSSGNLSISAKTDMPMYTSVGSDTWSNVPQRVKQVSSLPDSNTTFPLAGSAIPNWTKTEPYNWLNQSKSAVTSTTSWSGNNGNFLTFYNPVYYMDGSIQASTNTVYLTISGYSSVRVYPLQNDMSITAGSTSTSPTDYTGYWNATITDNGDGTGSVSYNPSEGSNLPPTPTSNQYNTGTSSSIIDYINQINQTLTNFAESFINLLKAPVAHIQQLVSAGSDFVGQLSGLYSWLPTEVYNTLTSAIILCISVGVLKVLL